MPTAAIALLREAVTIEDGLPYSEPPIWHHPPRQILGAVLLEAGRACRRRSGVSRRSAALPRERMVAVRTDARACARSIAGARRRRCAAAIRAGMDARRHHADLVADHDDDRSAESLGDATGGRRGSIRCARSAAPDVPALQLHTSSAAIRVARRSILLHGYTDSLALVRPRPAAAAVVIPRLRGDATADTAIRASPMRAMRPSDFARRPGRVSRRACGSSRPSIVGHSMGSTVAQRFAIDYPSRTRALVLEGAFLPRRRTMRRCVSSSETVSVASRIRSTRKSSREFQQSTLAGPRAARVLRDDRGRKPEGSRRACGRRHSSRI